MDKQKVPKKQRSLILRLLIFIITLALVVGAVFLIANHDRLNFDSLKRYFTYRSLERNDSGQARSFPYTGSSSDVFAAWGDDLLVCSSGGVRIYSGSGVCYVEDEFRLDSPAAEICGEYAAVYSPGSSSVYLYFERSRLGTIDDTEGDILSVRLNSSGWLAVTTQQSGYKAVVTVYDNDLEKRAAFRLSSAFVSDAVVTENCKSVAMVTMGQNGTSFESTLSVYGLPTAASSGVNYDLTPAASHSLGNNVILDIQGGSHIWCVGDYGVFAWNGKELQGWNCYDKYLKNYALCEDFAAMLIGKYKLSSQTELYTVDASGNPSAGRPINDQVLSLSASGKYVAVLTPNRLDIYTRDLDLYSTLDGTDGAKKVLMREDGTALLIGSETAHLYIPD